MASSFAVCAAEAARVELRILTTAANNLDLRQHLEARIVALLETLWLLLMRGGARVRELCQASEKRMSFARIKPAARIQLFGSTMSPFGSTMCLSGSTTSPLELSWQSLPTRSYPAGHCGLSFDCAAAGADKRRKVKIVRASLRILTLPLPRENRVHGHVGRRSNQT